MSKAVPLPDQLPPLNKAQQSVVDVSLAAYQQVLRCIIDCNMMGERAARQALMQSFEAMHKACSISAKLHEVPEAACSQASDDFRRDSSGWVELDIQRQLMAELRELQTKDEFNVWYRENRLTIDQVMTADLRNPLFDAIRMKKMEIG